MTTPPKKPSPELNARLLKIATLVPASDCLADIGTDHAYIPIWAISNKKVQKAIASDINPGPVNRAKENVSLFGLEDKISLRLGGGLSTISQGEANVVVIAGMGGILISNILDEDILVSRSAKTLILQPMTAAKELREYLLKNGFLIEREHLVAEDEKIYTIICAHFLGEEDLSHQYSQKDLILGKVFPRTDLGLFEKNKENITKKYQKRLSGLSASGREDAKEELEKVKEILEILTL